MAHPRTVWPRPPHAAPSPPPCAHNPVSSPPSPRPYATSHQACAQGRYYPALWPCQQWGPNGGPPYRMPPPPNAGPPAPPCAHHPVSSPPSPRPYATSHRACAQGWYYPALWPCQPGGPQGAPPYRMAPPPPHAAPPSPPCAHHPVSYPPSPRPDDTSHWACAQGWYYPALWPCQPQGAKGAPLYCTAPWPPPPFIFT